MRETSILIFAVGLALLRSYALADPPQTPPTTINHVFWLIGSDLETRNPAAVVGRAQVSGDKIIGKATVNDGGRICTARISGMVNQGADKSADVFLTLTTESGNCPSPLEFRGVVSSSGLYAMIEVDSKLVTAGA